MKFIAKNLEETQKIASDFVADLKPLKDKATVVGLYGNLGAGKTSFTQGVAQTLGVCENVVSPTFVIMKKYGIVGSSQHLASRRDLECTNQDASYKMLATGFQNLVHIDAYRIEHSDELLHLGWNEIISNPKNLIFIEWPEQVADIMPEHIQIKFSHTEGEEREIEIVE